MHDAEAVPVGRAVGDGDGEADGGGDGVTAADAEADGDRDGMTLGELDGDATGAPGAAHPQTAPASRIVSSRSRRRTRTVRSSRCG
jgi:hypothetical protein